MSSVISFPVFPWNISKFKAPILANLVILILNFAHNSEASKYVRTSFAMASLSSIFNTSVKCSAVSAVYVLRTYITWLVSHHRKYAYLIPPFQNGVFDNQKVKFASEVPLSIFNYPIFFIECVIIGALVVVRPLHRVAFVCLIQLALMKLSDKSWPGQTFLYSPPVHLLKWSSSRVHQWSMSYGWIRDTLIRIPVHTIESLTYRKPVSSSL